MAPAVVSSVRVLSRSPALAFICVIAAADTGAQTNTWRQCSTDISPAAIAACTSIIVSDPRNDGAYVNRGIAYRRAGDIERAIEDYDEAIRLNPGAADAFNNRGNAFRTRDEFERALRDYDEAIRLDPHYAHALNNRGIVFLEQGDAARAIADFDRAIRERASYANAFRNRGLARLQQRRYDLAVADFDEAFKLNPSIHRGIEYAVALFGRGVVRQQAGNPAGAADIAEATRLFPHVAEEAAGPDDR